MKLRSETVRAIEMNTAAQLEPENSGAGKRSTTVRSMLFASVALIALTGCSVTPEPLTLTDHAKRMNGDAVDLFDAQEPVTGPISLEEAMARAIKYNLDHRLKVMENALASQQLTSANLSMLPELTARVGYTGRNNHAGSNSMSLSDGTESLTSSSSSDRDLKTADLTLTWNVLDLGMSYVRANQQADRQLITQERRRKVLQNVIQNVRTSYWNAVSAERLLRKIEPLSVKVSIALDNARKAQQVGAEEPLQALHYRRDLLNVLRQLKMLRRELNTAKFGLAALMNLKPGSQFTLAPSSAVTNLPVFELDVDRLERLALVHRPELREEDYQGRISHNDVKLAYLDMIPGLSLNTGYNADSNSYAWEQTWFSWGSSVTANLFKVFTGPQKVDVSKARTDVVKVRRMALSMAVMSQVHVSVAGYNQAISEFKTASEMHEVEYEIFGKTQSNVQSGNGGARTVISAELQALLAELRQDMAYAEVRNAVGLLYVTIGADPLPDTLQDHDLKTVAGALKAVNDQWFTGTFDLTDPQSLSDNTAAPAATPVAAEEPASGVYSWVSSLFNSKG